MKLKSMRGFSLVELMIVVAIIGILAAIAIPNFIRFQTKARQAEARANLSAIYAAQKAFNAEWMQYFSDFNEIGYRPEGAFRYEHGFGAGGVVSPNSYTGAIMGGAAAVAINTNSAALRMSNGGTAACGGDILPATIAMNQCGVDRNPPGGALPALNAGFTSTMNTFFAGAVGNIDSDAAIDAWSIDENKAISGPGSVQGTPVTANCGDLDN